MKKIYALVDCNSFYVSCERLFNPSLKDKAVIVLSNNDGCAVALSKEAKSAGIKRGDPFFKIEKALEKVGGHAYSSNYSLYGDLSKRIMQVLEGTCPQMEVYSIDEAFLDLSGLEHLGLDEYGRYIKDKVYREVGLPVSVGIAHTKVLAKIANSLAKKSSKADGVLDLTNERFIDVALRRTSIDDVWGIGRRSAEKLKFLGIYTALEFRDYENDKKILKLLTKVGRQIQDELRGINCFELEIDTRDKDQIISSKSFGRGISDKREIKEALACYVSRACEKMRRQNSKTRTISIWLMTNRFSTQPQYFNEKKAVLLSASSDTRSIIVKAFELLDDIFKEGFIYKKAGVMLSALVEKDMSQLSFFEQGDNAKSIELMKVIDAINEREGSESIKSLACGLDPMWKTLCERKSAHFTTRWGEILTVKMDSYKKSG